MNSRQEIVDRIQGKIEKFEDLSVWQKAHQTLKCLGSANIEQGLKKTLTNRAKGL